MTVVAAVTRALLDLPNHADLTEATGLPVYFCDTYSQWPARQQREHQWPAPAVLPGEDRPLSDQPERLQQIVDQLNKRQVILGLTHHLTRGGCYALRAVIVADCSTTCTILMCV